MCCCMYLVDCIKNLLRTYFSIERSATERLWYIKLQLDWTDNICSVKLFGILSDIAPVIEGAVQHIASRRFEIGGIELTKLLAQELGKSNPIVKLNTSDVEKIKEQYSCCAEDDVAYEKTQQSCQEEKHTLPDGQVCSLIFQLDNTPHYM